MAVSAVFKEHEHGKRHQKDRERLTTMFRRLYWVVEQIGVDGQSRVTGVYTSIQDLIHRGLNWCNELDGHVVRLTLMKPDTFDSPLGQWRASDLTAMVEDLRNYIKTNEMTESEIQDLRSALEKFLATA